MNEPGREIEIRELKRGERDAAVLQQIVKLERRIFPKHESLAASLDLELSKKNSGLLFALAAHNRGQQQQEEDEICVAGYVIYSFTSSLAASIVKLADYGDIMSFYKGGAAHLVRFSCWPWVGLDNPAPNQA